MWTQFWDMHSGGGQKLDWPMIYIEAEPQEAMIIFQNAFGRDPENVTCSCCGNDYAIDSHESLAQLTGYHRGCRVLETPRLPDGRFDNGNPELRAHYYLEAGEQPPAGFKVDESLSFFKDDYVSLADYIKQPNVKVIPASEIRPSWRVAP